MYQKFTPKKANNCCDVLKDEKAEGAFIGPRKDTLAYIMQFACAYHVVEKQLPDSLSGMVLN